MPRFFGARLDVPPRQPERQSGRKPPENQADEILRPHPFSNSSWLSHGHCHGRCHFFVVFFVDVVSPLEGRGSSSFCLSARLANRQLEGGRSTPVEGLRLGRGALLPWADGGIEPRLLPPPPPPPPQLSSFFAPLPLPPLLRRCHLFLPPSSSSRNARSPNVPPPSDDATHGVVIFFFFVMTLRPLLPQPQSSLPRDVE